MQYKDAWNVVFGSVLLLCLHHWNSLLTLTELLHNISSYIKTSQSVWEWLQVLILSLWFWFPFLIYLDCTFKFEVLYYSRSMGKRFDSLPRLDWARPGPLGLGQAVISRNSPWLELSRICFSFPVICLFVLNADLVVCVMSWIMCSIGCVATNLSPLHPLIDEEKCHAVLVSIQHTAVFGLCCAFL